MNKDNTLEENIRLLLEEYKKYLEIANNDFDKAKIEKDNEGIYFLSSKIWDYKIIIDELEFALENSRKENK